MKLFYDDTETQQPPLVLVAGLATDSLSWILQRHPFSKDHRLITLDNRGVARSPIPEGPYTIAEMANDLLDLLDHLEVPKAHLVGHSLGGAIVQQFALDHPERVDRLVLACTFSHLEGRSIPVLEAWSEVVDLGPGPDLLAKCLLPWLYSESFFLKPGNLAAAMEAMKAHPYPMVGQGVKAQLAAIETFDSRPRLQDLKARTLVLAAEHDLLVSPTSCEKLAQAIPDATFQTLPEAGHSCMLETSAAFNAAVLEFLR